MAIKSMMIAMTMLAAAAFSPQDEKKSVEVSVDHDVTIEAPHGEAHHLIKVFTKTGDEDGDVIVLKQHNGNHFSFDINGKTLELDGESFPIGDSKTFDTEDGVVTITRNEDGIVITDEAGEETRVLTTGDHKMFLHKLSPDIKITDSNEIVISGLEGLGDEIRASITKALEEAGVDKDVVFKPQGNHFIWVDKDGHTLHQSDDAEETEVHQKKIIKKKLH